MSMNAIRQLNSGGLKMKSNFSTGSVAANISANRGGMASLVRGNSGGFGANGLFTKSNPIGRGSKYASAGQISRMVNRPAGQVRGLSAPVVSGSYTRDISFQPSNSANIGSVLGTLAGMLPMAMMGINQLGGAKAKSQGAAIDNAMSNAFGNYTPVDTGAIGASGIATASSFGSSFSSNYSSVEAYMKSESMDPGALRNSAKNLVSSAFNDVNNAEANFNILKGRQADAMSNQTKLQSDLDAAETDKNAANKEVGTRQGVLKGAKENRARLDDVLSKDNAEYKSACSDLTAKENIKEQKQTAVSECKTSLATAKSGLTQAQANVASAQQSYDAIPDDGKHSAQKAAAKSALEAAKDAEQKAQSAVENAEQKLKDAETELTEADKNVNAARDTKNQLLDKLSQDDSACKDAAKQCKDAESNVERAQKSYDAAKSTADTCQSTYIEAKAALDDANGVVAQCKEYETQMKTLKDNLVKATKLQEKANKAADKYEKKHPSATNNNNAGAVNASNANAGASDAGNVADNTDAGNTNAGNVGQGADHTINGGDIQEVIVKGKVKDLTTASDLYLQNLLESSKRMGDTAEVAKIQAEIDRRNAAKGVTV